MTRHHPTISFVIPAYNAAATLRRTIDSLKAQSMRDWEAILVDDGSTDGTRALLETLAAADPRIRWVARENGGPSAARNTGIAEARGTWLAFLDADDTLSPNFLARMLGALKKVPSAGVACCGYDLLNDKGGLIASYEAPKFLPDPVIVLAQGMHFVIHAAVFRRSIIDDIGVFDEHLVTNEDWDFWIRMARAGVKFITVDGRMAQYWNAPASNSKSGDRMITDSYVVTERLATRDPRLKVCLPQYEDGYEVGTDDAAGVHTLVSSVATAIGGGQAYRPLFEGAQVSGPVSGSEVEGIAASLFEGLMIGASRPYSDLIDLWPTIGPKIIETCDRVEAMTGTPGLAYALCVELEASIIRTGRFSGERPLHHTVGVMVGPAMLLSGYRPPTAMKRVEFRLPLLRPRGLFMVPYAALGPLSGLELVRLGLRTVGRRLFRSVFDRQKARRVMLHALSTAKRALRKARIPAGAAPAAHGSFAPLPGALPSRFDPTIAALVERSVATASAPSLVASFDRKSGEIGEQTDPDDPYTVWNAVYSKVDPWNYGSPYEQEKYVRTLALLGHEADGKALELACAEGRFTALLSERFATVRAVDVSSVAIERAKERLAGRDNIEFRISDFFNDEIPGEWDAIVCSEVLYFVGDAEKLYRLAGRIGAALRPGGTLVTAHAYQSSDTPERTSFDWGDPYGAATIRDAFIAAPGLRHVRGIDAELYRIDVFTRDQASIASPVPVQDEYCPVGVGLEPDVARHVVWNGAVELRSDLEQSERPVSLPVLMYHRIASDGPQRLRPWRTEPAEFERQLRFLRRRGFKSITLAEWDEAARSKAVIAGRPILFTFDDATTDFRDFAWPLLKKYGFGATVFVVTDKVGGTADWDTHHGGAAELLDWSDIAELAKEGVDFQSHLASHTAVNFLAPEVALGEAIRSRVALATRLGTDVGSLALPYGVVSRDCQQILELAGYRRVFEAHGRDAPIAGRRFATPRIEVVAPITLQQFAALIPLDLDPPDEGDELAPTGLAADVSKPIVLRESEVELEKSKH